MQSDQVAALRAQFEKIDTDNSGYIEMAELKEALAKHNVPEQELDKIIENVDYAGNKRINYTEFIAATLDIKTVLAESDQYLRSVFNSLDVDNTGKITRENIKLAFSKYGREITDSEITTILQKHDKKNNNVIDFDEFKAMIEDA